VRSSDPACQRAAGDDHDAFQLQVRYHRPGHEVTIRVTIHAEGLDHVNGTVAANTSQQNAVAVP
jgi:hypothetical protein